jgi:putative inorganic carbon (HCO3(-)) transporter
MLVFLLARILFKNDQDILHLLFAFGCSALAVSLFAITQWVFEIGIPAPWDIERRITSFFPYPNAVGLFLGPICVAGIFAAKQAWAQHKKPLLVFWIIVLFLSGAAIVLAQSEAAMLAVLTTTFLLSLFSRFWRCITVPLFAITILLIFLIPFARTMTWQKLTLQDYSGSVRLTQWEETWNMLKDHPMMGAGLAGYPEALDPYHTHSYIEIFQYPHNLFLNAWTELGLLGLVLLVFFGILLFRSTPRVRTSWIKMMVLAVFAEMFIHGLVDVPYFKNDLSVLSWIFVALLLYDTQSSPTKTSGHA